MTLTPEQESALNAICTFFKSDSNIFILKGYAGTGKTTLLNSLAKVLPHITHTRPHFLFAPTGRAAKILHEKTGAGSTIHKGIYTKESENFTYTENENFELIARIVRSKKDDARGQTRPRASHRRTYPNIACLARSR